MLKLYESGLPTWAIYMPRYGLPYRPWMRWLTWALFVAIATSSLIIGFWDLYKHMPYLEQARLTPQHDIDWLLASLPEATDSTLQQVLSYGSPNMMPVIGAILA